MCVSFINCNPNSNILEMKKIIDDITSTTFQGLMAISAVLLIIGCIILYITFPILSIVLIFGPHNMLWLRFLGVFLLFYAVGKIVGR
jgi:hypothetical protein